jgi:hypothetical protein
LPNKEELQKISGPEFDTMNWQTDTVRGEKNVNDPAIC